MAMKSRRRSTWDPLWKRHCAAIRAHGQGSPEVRRTRLALARWHERQGLPVPWWITRML